MHIISMQSSGAAITLPVPVPVPDMPAEIRPHPVEAGFQKFESGTSPAVMHCRHIAMR